MNPCCYWRVLDEGERIVLLLERESYWRWLILLLEGSFIAGREEF